MDTDTTNRHGSRWARRLGVFLAGAIGVLALVLGLAPAAGAQGLAARSTALSSSARLRAVRAYRHDRSLHLYRFGHRRAPLAHSAVVGGVQRSIEEVPWQVAVLAEFEFEGEAWGILCGGSIVDMSHIVTAAHCTYNPFTEAQLPADDFVVLAGASSISEEEILHGTTVEARFVEGIRRHPDFNYAAGPSTPDDVAVLGLEDALVPSAGVSAIALPSSPAGPVEGTAVSLSGFGAENSTGSEINGNLYSLATTLTDPVSCGGNANAVFLCTSAPAGSICSGDSGGGLIESPGGSPTLIGVVDTVRGVEREPCRPGALDGFANVTAPEIRDFVEGSEDPPLAPQGGGVTMRGTPMVGHELTCEPGSWSNDPSFTYAFVDSAGGRVLQQGSSSSYLLSAADVGLTVSCQLEATNAGGTARVHTEASPPVQPAPSETPSGGGGQGNGGGNGGSNGGGGNGGNSGGSTTPVTPTAVTPGGDSSAGGSTDESAHGGVLGYHAKQVGADEIAALLRTEIIPRGAQAQTSKLLGAAHYTLAFRALEAGTAVVKWYALPTAPAGSKSKGKPVLIATGRRTFSGATKAKLVVELTAAGKRLLRGRGSLRCNAEGVFTARGTGPVVAVRSFTLSG
jgi:hypothetical protein